ncbi:protein adenylyltransferase SelO [Aquibacillus salsiterrae]|uniref:Protein nucleotidyltransferase YdiU n=1 Tax=Aquibacillus salsiterrae TaxID=2950439 RepID=A0A9X3WE82_9BACI|nr:YdiU family protein [Aquibacillus salsiterrae]MDC3417403.1 YdiU family protein [Aquibacillus salsiterrae]
MTNIEKGKGDSMKERTTGWNIDNSYSRLPNTFYQKQNPTPVESPKIVCFNHTLVESLGLDAKMLSTNTGAQIFGGNQIPNGSEPLAQAYAGHQFGHFTMLGDGRAVLLGEQLTPDQKRFDVQLKGAGRTPYSRGGDGRAALGPMLREYIISEAMYYLGIPTTRSLAVVTTGETISRETELTGAVLTRIASSHLRVGTFQYAYQWASTEELQELADYAINRHYPEVVTAENKYLSFLREVIEKQASLIAQWQLVGFIHGVMNTDNMTISGETIDYGPCAFMNEYDPKTVFSSIDVHGRYAYANQPPIGGWNLVRLAESLLPLIHDDDDLAVDLAQAEISRYMDVFETYWLQGMRAKLGIFNEESEDKQLVENLLEIMQKNKADFTNTFRALTFHGPDDFVLFETVEFKQWNNQWQKRLKRQPQSDEAVRKLMKQCNPAVIPRNHLVEEAIEAAVDRDDYRVMERLLEILSKPYAHTADQNDFAKLPPKTNVPYRTFCGT